MKLCPQCEFLYEDDQKFCDMDGRELVHDPKPHAFAEGVPSASAQLHDDQDATAVTPIHIPIPERMPRPVATVPGSLPANVPLRWQPMGLVVAALACIFLVAVLFVVYYARMHQSQAPNANRAASESASQSGGQSQGQPATESPDAQSGAPGGAESATLGDTAGEALEQAPSDQSANPAGATSQSSPTTDSSSANVRRGSTLVASSASSDANRAPVIIQLTNGASIKADEAWENRDGVWYRQAGVVTFLKRSQVRSIQRPASNRSQTQPRAEKPIAQNQPRVSKPAATEKKKDSKVTSFLKSTGRILKKPFKL